VGVVTINHAVVSDKPVPVFLSVCLSGVGASKWLPYIFMCCIYFSFLLLFCLVSLAESYISLFVKVYGLLLLDYLIV